jgi:hypothetical protein
LAAPEEEQLARCSDCSPSVYVLEGRDADSDTAMQTLMAALEAVVTDGDEELVEASERQRSLVDACRTSPGRRMRLASSGGGSSGCAPTQRLQTRSIPRRAWSAAWNEGYESARRV